MKSQLQLVQPPLEWVDNGVEGISIGQCIAHAVKHGITRGGGISWEANAHAHNQMFLDTQRLVPDPHFGWICCQPFDSQRFSANESRLGTIVKQSDTLTLTEPSVLAFHEYAHILVPWELYCDDPKESKNGHGPRWQQMMIELGWPAEASRYDLRLNLKRGPAAYAGFRPQQQVRVRNDPRILPKYLQGAVATIIRVLPTRLILEFHDIDTKTINWPYQSIERLPQ